MPKIVKKQLLAQSTILFNVQAPEIASHARAGQFVVVRLNDTAERIPLTIADMDSASGEVTLVLQEIGHSTKKLCALNEGDQIRDIAGPLGHPSHIEKIGTVIGIGGGIGVAPLYPVLRAFKETGNKVIAIIGARSKNLLFWEDKIRAVSHEVYITTDDGSRGEKGLVINPLNKIIQDGAIINEVFAVGPAVMMRAVADTTRPHNIRTFVSLNPIMIDGTGMCGVCRVEVGGETKFTCVDGPDFDAHKVNFALLMQRQKMYRQKETESMAQS